MYLGSIYFLLVSVVHAVGLKIPGLYIYYNVPSYAYQDRVISFLVFGWSVFFFLTAKSPALSQIKSILIMGFAAIIMLAFINLQTDFAAFSVAMDTTVFHAQVGILFLYWFWLLAGYLKLKHEKGP